MEEALASIPKWVEEMAFWLQYLGANSKDANERLAQLLDLMNIDEEQWMYNYDMLAYIHVGIPMSYDNIEDTKD